MSDLEIPEGIRRGKDNKAPFMGKPLGVPQKAFADTFSAETVIVDSFFPSPAPKEKFPWESQ